MGFGENFRRIYYNYSYANCTLNLRLIQDDLSDIQEFGYNGFKSLVQV